MTTDQDSSNCSDELKKSIIESIINEKNVFFMHQQKDDTDLSLNEKKIIVENLLESNKSLFLQRYGQYLDLKSLTFFSNETNEDIKIQIDNFRNKIQRKNKLFRNRRYQALQKLLKDGTYFSDSEMQSRNPYLFKKMIGQYINEKESKELQNSNYQQNYDRIGFSSYLFETIRQNDLENRIKKESNHIDEFFDDEDDDDEMNENKKEYLRKEFLKIMIENFLDGKDGDYFDYDKVDNNYDYDLSIEFEQDQQDRYFDDDE